VVRSAARRLLAMRRELRQVLDGLGVGVNSPGGMPAVTAKETDALNALDREIVHCAVTLNARMRADGQEPGDWDYPRTTHDRAELTWPESLHPECPIGSVCHTACRRSCCSVAVPGGDCHQAKPLWRKHMKKIGSRKLALVYETVTLLTNPQLRHAAGANSAGSIIGTDQSAGGACLVETSSPKAELTQR